MRVDHACVDLSRIFTKKIYMHDARPPRRAQLHVQQNSLTAVQHAAVGRRISAAHDPAAEAVARRLILVH